jgi:nucleoside-diphosphate-sugar epimerase
MILVTGHKGYIGNKLFNRLNQMGYEVIGIDLKDGHDIADCLPKNKNFDYVFHLAALPSVEYSVLNPSYTLKHNVLATSKLLEWSKDNKVKRFIFSSSSAIYGDGNGPKSPYGLHKLMSEQECKLYSELYGLDTVCLRYYNLYSEDQKYGGAYSTAISAWMEMINIKKPLRIDGDGEQTRDFVHIDDVIKANLFCMNRKENFNGKFYDIGSGKSISLNYIKNYIDQFNEVKWDHRPERVGDVKHTKANIQEMLNFGWTSEVSIEEGLERCFKRRNI